MFKRVISTIAAYALVISISLCAFSAQGLAETTVSNPDQNKTQPVTDQNKSAAATMEKYLDTNAHQWFYPYLSRIKGLSLLTGETPLLKPYEPVTLSEIHTLLQAQDNEIKNASEAIQKSIALKILDENADLNKALNREDLYSAVGKYYKLESSKKLYEDTANPYVNGILENNIVTPIMQNGKYIFHPKRLASRAEAIVLIEKVKQFKADSAAFKPLTPKPVFMPILIYHEITEDADKLAKAGSLFVSPSKFKQDIQAFQKNNYTAVTFEDVKAFVDGYAVAPAKPYVITFDDGYKGNYTYAFKTAKELNTRFVINIVSENISRYSNYSDAYSKNQHLTEQDIWEMHGSGLVEFQSHTYNQHRDFGPNSGGNGMTPFKQESESDYWSRIQDDLQKSSGTIRFLTGYSPCELTYPMGMYNNLVDNIAFRNGYLFTLTTEKGVSNLCDGTSRLKRIHVSNSTSSDDLVKLADSH